MIIYGNQHSPRFTKLYNMFKYFQFSCYSTRGVRRFSNHASLSVDWSLCWAGISGLFSLERTTRLQNLHPDSAPCGPPVKHAEISINLSHLFDHFYILPWQTRGSLTSQVGRSFRHRDQIWQLYRDIKLIAGLRSLSLDTYLGTIASPLELFPLILFSFPSVDCWKYGPNRIL